MGSTATSLDFDRKAFRQALGTFATGVTIVTAWDEITDAPVGVTASSFNSVSVDPPLVLWSVGRNALSAKVLISAKRYAIHVLHSGQSEIANRFARSGADKFGPTDYERDAAGVPILKTFASRFDCELHDVHGGGDHHIIVGRVVGICHGTGDPLVFHGGRYASALPLELLSELRSGN